MDDLRLSAFALALTSPINDVPSMQNELLAIQRQRLIEAGFIILSEPVDTVLGSPEVEPSKETEEPTTKETENPPAQSTGE